MNVLIVEDDHTCRSWLRIFMQRLGFNVVGEAGDGLQALEKATSTQPDLVLLDISMPFRTGNQVLPDILAACPNARVVMLSSIADLETVRECLEKGAVNYIRKDAEPEEIEMILETVVGEMSQDPPTKASHV